MNLPHGFGVNVNVPPLDTKRTAASYPVTFTQVTSASGGEARAFDAGNTVTVSPIQGTYQAPPAASSAILAQMKPLITKVEPFTDPELINLSVRGFVGVGASVQIAGFTISGSASETVLIRASGPALDQFNVPGTLDDPAVELFNADNRLVASNDNWSDDATKASAIASAAARAGAFAWPKGSKDAALLIALPPGNYTVVLRGVGNTSGVALIEIYDIDDK